MWWKAWELACIGARAAKGWSVDDVAPYAASSRQLVRIALGLYLVCLVARVAAHSQIEHGEVSPLENGSMRSRRTERHHIALKAGGFD